MKLVCEHCKQSSKKYNAVDISADWLQSYLEDYFDRKIDFDFRPTDKKELRIRRMIIYLFKEFTSLTHVHLAKRFHTNTAYICDAIQKVDLLNHDLKFIMKDLKGELPVMEPATAP